LHKLRGQRLKICEKRLTRYVRKCSRWIVNT
jgi:hypothetical protein